MVENYNSDVFCGILDGCVVKLFLSFWFSLLKVKVVVFLENEERE